MPACSSLTLTHSVMHHSHCLFCFFYFFFDVSHVIAVPVARRSPDQPYPHACTCPIHYRTNSLEVLVRNLLLSLATAKTPQKRGHVVIYLSKYFFEWGMGRGWGKGEQPCIGRVNLCHFQCLGKLCTLSLDRAQGLVKWGANGKKHAGSKIKDRDETLSCSCS